MLDARTELKLARLLKEIAVVETYSERNRISLCNNLDFDAYTAFYTLDATQEGQLGADDLDEFLVLNNFSRGHSDIDLLLDAYDRNRDGRLSYTEFLALVLPASVERRSSPIRKATALYSPKFLPKNIKWELGLLIEKELDGLRRINELKNEVLRSYDWNPSRAFQSIDIDDHGYIDRGSLAFFFRKNEIYTDREEVSSLLRRLDKDYDGRISYSEFLDMLDPYEKKYAHFNPRQDRYSKSPTRRGRSRSNDICISNCANIFFFSGPNQDEIRYRQHTDELIRNSLLRSGSPNYRERSTIMANEIEQIKELVDRCLRKSHDYRSASKRSSPGRYRDDEPHAQRYSARYDETVKKPIARAPLSQYTTPERRYPRRTYDDEHIDFDFTKIPYNKPLLDIIVDKTIRRSQEARSRSASPERYETERKIPSGDNADNKAPTKIDPELSKSQEPPQSQEEAVQSPEKAKQDEEGKVIGSTQDLQTEKKGLEEEKQETKDEPGDLKLPDLRDQMKLSPMKGQEEYALVKALQEIIDLDQVVENIRDNLVQQDDFDPVLAYQTLLDPKGTNRSDMWKLGEVLSSAKIQVSSRELRLVFERLDKDNDGIISEKDFEEIIYPKERKLANELVQRANKTELSAKTKELLDEFFRQLVQTEKEVEDVRKRLSKRSLFDLEEAFKVLDSANQGAITEEGFQALLEKYKISVSARQLENLLHRFDADFDGKVSIREFYNEMAPHH